LFACDQPRSFSPATVAIVNPASGRAISAEELPAAFQELDRRVERRETSESDPGAGQAANAVASGATTVVACGGDGTVRACLAPLADTDTVLGAVALGTGAVLSKRSSTEWASVLWRLVRGHPLRGAHQRVSVDSGKDLTRRPRDARALLRHPVRSGDAKLAPLGSAKS
jgi:hypothetical protein